MDRFAEQFQQGVGNAGKVVLDGEIQIGVLFLRLFVDRALHRGSEIRVEDNKV